MFVFLTILLATPSIELSEQRARRDERTDNITFSMTVTNQLPVPVKNIEVGLLYAEKDSELANIQAGPLYARPGKHHTIVALVSTLEVEIESGNHAELQVEFSVDDEIEANAFATHVLGYDALNAPVELLFSLITTDRAADERAAVNAVALLGSVEQRSAARLVLQKNKELLDVTTQVCDSNIPERPSHEHMMERVYCALTLGQIGGGGAQKTLTLLASRPALSRFDEPLQILRIARATSTRREAPLSYAVPRDASTMRAVVEHALSEANGELVARVDEYSTPSGEGHVVEELERDNNLDSKTKSKPVGLFAVIMVGVGIGAWYFFRTKKLG